MLSLHARSQHAPGPARSAAQTSRSGWHMWSLMHLFCSCTANTPPPHPPTTTSRALCSAVHLCNSFLALWLCLKLKVDVQIWANLQSGGINRCKDYEWWWFNLICCCLSRDERELICKLVEKKKGGWCWKWWFLLWFWCCTLAQLQ